MGRRFAQIASTPQVKRNQEMRGSRRQYERVENFAEDGNALGAFEKEFILDRDDFYMASVSESGRPYIQYRGGPKGFLRILDRFVADGYYLIDASEQPMPDGVTSVTNLALLR